MGEIIVETKPSNISWDAIANLLAESHKDNIKRGFTQNSSHMKGSEIEKKVSNGMCFIAKDGETVVGTLSVIPRKKANWYCNKGALYCMLAGVSPKYKGKGVYSLLAHARDEYARKMGFPVVYLYTPIKNRRMQKAAKKDGFIPVSFSVSTDTTYYSVIMAKWLNGCPFNQFYCLFKYFYSQFYIRLNFKVGAIKRF